MGSSKAVQFKRREIWEIDQPRSKSPKDASLKILTS